MKPKNPTDIERVPSFKSTDGSLHTTKKDALERNYAIELRGLFQRSIGNASMQSYSAIDVARVLKANSKTFITTMRKFDDAIQRNTPKEISVPTIIK